MRGRATQGRNAPNPQNRTQSRVMEWTKQTHVPDKFPIDDTSTIAPPEDRVAIAKAYFMGLNEDERSQVSDDLGNSSDFPST